MLDIKADYFMALALEGPGHSDDSPVSGQTSKMHMIAPDMEIRSTHTIYFWTLV